MGTMCRSWRNWRSCEETKGEPNADIGIGFALLHDHYSPIVALILRTPAEEASSFLILTTGTVLNVSYLCR